MRPQTRWQRGVSLITAIFMLVILSVAGAYMVNITGSQQTTTSYALLGSRAYRAAQAGIEWGIFKSAADPTACPGSATFTLDEGGLDGFSVTVDCVEDPPNSYTEGTTTYYIIRLISTATYGSFGDRNFISREVRAVVVQ